ncbi:MAG: alanyl-tRNA editing protein [Clostridia bacterium]|nr:alanyl-tRNA editing protein [Clostridia bacterium]
MTVRLYEDDGMLRSMQAQVLSCEKTEGGYAVVLDQTVFFPEGGGQNADCGTIDGIPVLDVQLSGDTVIHTLESPLEVGKTVTGELDWNIRFARMQSHSGEHILSGTLHNLYGVNNVGFHMGSEDVTLDVDAPLSRAQLIEAEQRANAVIARDAVIRAWYPDAEELANLPYRSKKQIDAALRIVEVEGTDRCACCAPHVHTAGQVGIVKILDAIHYKGGMRLHILCGLEAVADYEKKYQAVSACATALSVKQEELFTAVSRLQEENGRMNAQIRGMYRAMGKMLADTVQATDGNVCVFASALDNEGMREFVNTVMPRCGGVCAIFAGENGNYRYVIGSENVPLRAFVKDMNAALNGRGGGKDSLVQGTVAANEEAIRAYFD